MNDKLARIREKLNDSNYINEACTQLGTQLFETWRKRDFDTQKGKRKLARLEVARKLPAKLLDRYCETIKNHTVPQASKILGISERMVWYLIYKHKLDYVKQRIKK